MKKKKGFTLIELLAVIVILAVIMIIAVPKILDLIEESRQSAALESGQLYVDAVNKYMSFNEMDSVKYPFVKNDDNNYTVDDLKEYIQMKGSYPTSGDLTITKKVTSADLCINGYNVVYDNNSYSVSKSNKCGSSEESEVIVEDKVPCELEVDENDSSILYIDSVSDLYKFSQNVNNGTTYSSKKIYLRNNLDMSDTSNTCGEESFTPIGFNGKSFGGTFHGNAKTIRNLTINLPDSNYVGLFGYVSNGTIVGLTIENANITGKDYVGALYGRSNSTNLNIVPVIEYILIKNSNIKGNSYVSFLGSNNQHRVESIIIRNSNITTQNNEYSKDIYKVVNGGNSIYSCIIESGKINNESIRYVSSTNSSYVKEGEFPQNDIGDINFYAAAGFETWLAISKNINYSYGYYFDYKNDTSNEIIIYSKSQELYPIDADSAFEKNSDGYYLIKDEKDWKNLAALSRTPNVNFLLENDLDFSNKHFYMVGHCSLETGQDFISNFDGGANTIKNVTIKSNSASCIGIFGSTTNTIKGLNVSNINIEGYNSVGAIVGNGYAKLNEITADNIKIKGNSKVSAIGTNYDSSSVSVQNVLIKNAQVSGNLNVGFVSTYPRNISNIIVENATVTGTTLSGGCNSSVKCSENVKFNGETQNDAFEASKIDDIDFYSGTIETRIGGDRNSTGYYFDNSSAHNNQIWLIKIPQ